MHSRRFLRIISVVLFFVLSSSTIEAAFLQGTLVRTGRGHVPIETLKAGDKVVGCLQNKAAVLRKIHKIEPKIVKEVYIITTARARMVLTPEQLVYDVTQKAWVRVDKLTTNARLYDINFEEVACEKITKVEGEAQVYEVTIAEPHMLYITEGDLLVHNFLPALSIGFSFLFGTGGITWQGITAGVCVLGTFFGMCFHAAKRGESRKATVVTRRSSGGGMSGGPEDPKDDEKKRRKINNITRTEFLKQNGIRQAYRYYKDDIYSRIQRTFIGICKAAEYLKWDYTHNEVEVFNKGGRHLGAIDPSTWEFIKKAVPGRTIDV